VSRFDEVNDPVSILIEKPAFDKPTSRDLDITGVQRVLGVPPALLARMSGAETY
jgi:hypothetical protein